MTLPARMAKRHRGWRVVLRVRRLRPLRDFVPVLPGPLDPLACAGCRRSFFLLQNVSAR